MAREVIEQRIKEIIGTKPNKESVDTIYWFKNNNPTYDLDMMIMDYYGR